MVASAGHETSMLREALTKRRPRCFCKGVCAYTNYTLPAATVPALLARFVEEVHAASRPVSRLSDFAEQPGSTNPPFEVVEKSIEPHEVGEPSHSCSDSQASCSPRLRCSSGSSTVTPALSSGSTRNSRYRMPPRMTIRRCVLKCG